MKKILLFLLVFFISVDIVSASSIDKVDMNIVIDENGTATITETWNAYVNQGTEGWHPYYNIGKSEIRVLSASIDGDPYTIVNSWSENSSLNAKAYKAGLYRVGSNEYDIVFGITNYGNHEYQVVYEITNFVSNIDDADIVYWQLFPYDFSAAPDNVTITISGYYEYPDSLDVWGFGMYGAPCYVHNGKIYMTSDGPISSSEYLTILVKYPKGTFNTTSYYNHTFDEFLSMAKDGATDSMGDAEINGKYNTGVTSISGPIKVVIFGYVAFFVSIFVGLPILLTREFNKTNVKVSDSNDLKLPKEVNNYREIPCNKDIYCAYYLSNTYSLTRSKNDFLGVLLLKWIQDGNVTISKITKKKLLKDKEESVIKFEHEPENAPQQEKDLYKYMNDASGDGILESNEFEKWCRKNYSKILGWPDKVIKYEENILISQNEITKVPYEKGLVFKYTCHKNVISDVMREEAIKLKGLKKFLVEFSQIKEKQPIEVKLWNEYLMYAQIFGIAEKVMEQFKKLYPEIVSEMEINNFDYNTFVFVNSLSRSGMSSASSARSAAQSYSGGGGGFSSGGGGGGSFGGGGGGGGFR